MHNNDYVPSAPPPQILDASHFYEQSDPPPPYNEVNYPPGNCYPMSPHPQQNVHFHVTPSQPPPAPIPQPVPTPQTIYVIHQHQIENGGGGGVPGDQNLSSQLDTMEAQLDRIEVALSQDMQTDLMLDQKARLIFVRKIFSVLVFHLIVSIGEILLAKSRLTDIHENQFQSDVSYNFAFGSTIIGGFILITCSVWKSWRNYWYMSLPVLGLLSACVVYLMVYAVSISKLEIYYKSILFMATLTFIFVSFIIFTFQPWLDFNVLWGILLILVSSVIMICLMGSVLQVASDVLPKNVTTEMGENGTNEHNPDQEGEIDPLPQLFHPNLANAIVAAAHVGIYIVAVVRHMMVRMCTNSGCCMNAFCGCGLTACKRGRDWPNAIVEIYFCLVIASIVLLMAFIAVIAVCFSPTKRKRRSC